uniref:Grave disease carrier protein n=1 Tax=Rhizophora mucronata TaxID=61149 RepID=A0A2P2QD79_RHIMU
MIKKRKKDLSVSPAIDGLESDIGLGSLSKNEALRHCFVIG